MIRELARQIEGGAGYSAASADVVHHERDGGVGSGCTTSLRVCSDVHPQEAARDGVAGALDMPMEPAGAEAIAVMCSSRAAVVMPMK